MAQDVHLVYLPSYELIGPIHISHIKLESLSLILTIVRECPSSDFIPTNPDHARHVLPQSRHKMLDGTLKTVGMAVLEHCGKLYQLWETVTVLTILFRLHHLLFHYINRLPLQGLTQSSSHKSIPVKVSTL